MGWREKLRPGTFRGVPFEVDGDKVPVGRRTVTHEYPGRSIPYVEDMGRVTREYKVTAFVIGQDCLEKRDALLKAIETEGAGELVHPWLGTLKVTAGVGEMSHAYSEGGVVRFELTFTESGDLSFPSGTANTGKLASQSSTKLAESSLSRFEQAMAAVKTAQVAVGAIMKTVNGVYAAMQQALAPIAAAIGTAQSLVSMILNAPAELTSAIRGVYASVTGAFHVFDGYSGSLANLFGFSSTVASVNALPAPGGAQAQQVHIALVNLVSDLLLVEAVQVVSEMPVVTAAAPAPTVPTVDVQLLQPAEVPDVPVADDFQALRSTLTEALWQQSQAAPIAHYQALTDARIQLGRHLVAVARQGVRLTTVTPGQAVPALVMAYARYGDANRAAEIVLRNRVAHPGFLPPAALKVAVK